MPETLTADQERENKIAALVIATSATTRVLVRLKKQIKHFAAHPLVGKLSTQIVELQTQLLWLDNEFEDVLAGGGSIAALGRKKLEEIAALSREVDELIRNAQVADALLGAASAAIKLANEVKAAAG